MSDWIAVTKKLPPKARSSGRWFWVRIEGTTLLAKREPYGSWWAVAFPDTRLDVLTLIADAEGKVTHWIPCEPPEWA